MLASNETRRSFQRERLNILIVVRDMGKRDCRKMTKIETYIYANTTRRTF